MITEGSDLPLGWSREALVGATLPLVLVIALRNAHALGEEPPCCQTLSSQIRVWILTSMLVTWSSSMSSGVLITLLMQAIEGSTKIALLNLEGLGKPS